jgi:hypothetical protein
MRRRHFVKSLVAAPAAPALLAQRPVGPPDPTARAVEEVPKLESTVADAAAEMMPHFFSAEQFAALRRLSDILMPALNGAPGALDARAPEFLDFLIGSSPAERQQLYRAGLDALNAQAKRRSGKAFADAEAAQADALLEPLRQAWTYDPPADPLGRFLRTAKQDVRTATMNSREWSTVASSGGRRQGGVGLYWYRTE